MIKFSKIIKLHTKTSDKEWFNHVSDFLLKYNVSGLQALQNSDCNCVGPKEYIYTDIGYTPNRILLDKYKNVIDKTKFVRGSMFYCDKKVFDILLELVKSDYNMY
ncbi:MAG: hypothetical protein Gaeavirus29_4, partial [Gaeavirus sp.]